MSSTESKLGFESANVIVAIGFGVILGMSVVGLLFSIKKYKDTTKDYCQQYLIYPEKHLDKVPPACQPLWFKENGNE